MKENLPRRQAFYFLSFHLLSDRMLTKNYETKKSLRSEGQLHALCPLVKVTHVVILLGNFIFRSPTAGKLLRL